MAGLVNPYSLGSMQRVHPQTGEPIGEPIDLNPPEKITVYVVVWKPQGVGGFDWFYKREDAEQGLTRWTAEDDPHLHQVEVPNLASSDLITDWIDDNWYDL